jgi:hypothetical protein
VVLRIKGRTTAAFKKQFSDGLPGVVVAQWLGVIAFGPQGITWFQQITTPYSTILPTAGVEFCATLVVYYLVWKYIGAALNRVLEIV